MFVVMVTGEHEEAPGNARGQLIIVRVNGSAAAEAASSVKGLH
ncbi:MAG TPA: hypothetical protein VHR39_00340 [Propionibacteriaceae bacterium]|jgi:hypothetical protein|nr:hypothetical protein [Propionibacteriaceae bacterium]